MTSWEYLARILAFCALIGLLVGFGAFEFSQTLMRTPCCADDSYFAMVARELASTGRFGVPISNTEFSDFDVENGGGPALILPLAALFRIFGVNAWLPGLTTILLLTGPLAVSFLLLSRKFGAARTAIFAVFSLALLIVVMHYSTASFYAFLGEGPAAAWILLGATTLVTTNHTGLAGACFALAFLTKQIALFSIVGIIAVWIIVEWREQSSPMLSRLIVLAFAAATPVVGFELWKIITFGLEGYLNYLERMLAATSHFAVAKHDDRLSQTVSILRDRYFIDLVIAALAAISASCALRWSRLGVMLWAGAAVHLVYVVVLSTLWQRYFFIGVALAAFAIPAPLLAAPRAFVGFASPFLVLFVAVRTVPTLQSEFAFGPTVDLRERNIVLRLLDELSNYTIHSAAWMTSFDILLFLPRDRPWSLNPDPASLDGKTVVVIFNKRFYPPDHDYLRRVRNCEQRFNGEVFLVAICRSEQSRAPAPISSAAVEAATLAAHPTCGAAFGYVRILPAGKIQC